MAPIKYAIGPDPVEVDLGCAERAVVLADVPFYFDGALHCAGHRQSLDGSAKSREVQALKPGWLQVWPR